MPHITMLASCKRPCKQLVNASAILFLRKNQQCDLSLCYLEPVWNERLGEISYHLQTHETLGFVELSSRHDCHAGVVTPHRHGRGMDRDVGARD